MKTTQTRNTKESTGSLTLLFVFLPHLFWGESALWRVCSRTGFGDPVTHIHLWLALPMSTGRWRLKIDVLAHVCL